MPVGPGCYCEDINGDTQSPSKAAVRCIALASCGPRASWQDLRLGNSHDIVCKGCREIRESNLPSKIQTIPQSE